MGHPTSKSELLKGIRAEHKRLEKALEGLFQSEIAGVSNPDSWSVKDNLAHITAWEKKLINWYQTGLQGGKQTLPQWDNPGVVDEINLGIYQKNRDRQLADVLDEYQKSYQRILEVVNSIPEADMFTTSRFEWTGNDILARFIVSNTSSHYAEHIKMIEAIKKKL
jgi:hypothetical protein